MPGPAVPAQARPGRAGRRADRCSRSPATRAGRSGRGRPTSPASGPDDQHFTIDLIGGRGPARAGRPARRTARCAATARCPPKGAHLRVREYRVGGGRRGNVAAARRSRVLKSSIPFVARVENRRPARGGVDGEDIENAKVRGPIRLRTRDRAVTTEDYEQLAREAAPEVARVRAVAAGDGADAGSVRVLVVPRRRPRPGPAPVRPARARPRTRSRRSPTASTSAGSSGRGRSSSRPSTAASRSWPSCGRGRAINPTRLQEEALPALYAYFHPITGGPDGTGWPFGRPVNVGEVYSVLQGLRGTELVEDARLFGADPVTGAAGPADPAARARDPRPGVQLRAPGPGRGRLMRGVVAGLASPHPLGPTLPGHLPGRRLRRSGCSAALDEVLAPDLLDHRQLRLVPRPVAHARRLPRLARRLGGDRARRELGRGPAAGDRRPGGRAVPAAGHRGRAGRPGRDPDRRHGRDRRERRRPAGPWTRRRAARVGRAAGGRPGHGRRIPRRSTPGASTAGRGGQAGPRRCTGSRSSRAPRRDERSSAGGAAPSLLRPTARARRRAGSSRGHAGPGRCVAARIVSCRRGADHASHASLTTRLGRNRARFVSPPCVARIVVDPHRPDLMRGDASPRARASPRDCRSRNRVARAPVMTWPCTPDDVDLRARPRNRAVRVHGMHHDDRPDLDPCMAFTTDTRSFTRDGPISASRHRDEPSILCPTLAGRWRVG